MADERRYYSSGESRRANEQPRPRVSSNTHSSYEDVIRRSNERLGNAQRRARRMSEIQNETYNDVNTSYMPRRQQASSVGRSYQRERSSQGERRTIKLHSFDDDVPPQQHAQRPPQAQPMRQAPVEQQRGISLPVNLPNPFSRQQPGNLRQQQFQGRSRMSGNYQSQRPSFPSIGMPVQTTGFNGVVLRAVICLVLLIVVIFSFTRIGPAAAGLSEAQSNVATQQEALDKQNSDNESLQAQIDQMQETIDKYNDLKASQS